MSTKMTSFVDSENSDETIELGKILGQRLKGGEIIELVSDVGGGKTTFTRGIAEGIGSADHVSSPTFKICNTYRAKDLLIYHYDFYRLQDAGLMRHELAEALDDKKAVIVVEWGNIVRDVLPSDVLRVNINSTGDSSRQLVYEYPQNMEYLIK